MNTTNKGRPLPGGWGWLVHGLALVCVGFAVLITLAGCGGGTQTPADGTGTAAGSGGGNDGPAAPSEHATGFGEPQGGAVSAVIGVAGGQLSTADGGLTLQVPAGAFDQDRTVVIQPISNLAHGAVGRAYRISPEGLHTTVPMTLRLHYSDAEIANTHPSFLSVAYQDTQGLWHAYRAPTVDTNGKTVTVQTTHFSDWSTFSGVQLRPPQATVHVGQTLTLQVMYCEEVAEDTQVAALHKCVPWDPAERTLFWSVNGVLGGGGTIGTVAGLASTDASNDAVYTAPPHVPNGNSMRVAVSAEIYNVQHPEDRAVILVSNVTVEDELARSCEWLRTAGDLQFDIQIDPLHYDSSDGVAQHGGQHSARLTGRLKSQAQAPQLGWWVADPATIQGVVSIDDLDQSPSIRSTRVGSGVPYVASGGGGADFVGSGLAFYVDYTHCTYTFSAGFAVQATVTTTYLQAENPPEVQQMAVRVGSLGFEALPLYATYATLRSVHSEQQANVVPTLEPGSSGYAPDGQHGTLQPGSVAAARWTIGPLP
jgi:hypothetical protein